PTAYKILSEGAHEIHLGRVGRWVKVERVFRTEPDATTLTLDFRICDPNNANIGEMWIDNVSLEPVVARPAGPWTGAAARRTEEWLEQLTVGSPTPFRTARFERGEKTISPPFQRGGRGGRIINQPRLHATHAFAALATVPEQGEPLLIFHIVEAT